MPMGTPAAMSPSLAARTACTTGAKVTRFTHHMRLATATASQIAASLRRGGGGGGGVGRTCCQGSWLVVRHTGPCSSSMWSAWTHRCTCVPAPPRPALPQLGMPLSITVVLAAFAASVKGSCEALRLRSSPVRWTELKVGK